MRWAHQVTNAAHSFAVLKTKSHNFKVKITMKNIALAQSQYEMLSDLLKDDIQNLANCPAFFQQCGIDPKEYIDERIVLCRLFEIDFWNIVEIGCPHTVLERLKALYEGKTIKEFLESYEEPGESERLTRFFKALLKGKGGSN
jgi:hypothetical protein